MFDPQDLEPELLEQYKWGSDNRLQQVTNPWGDISRFSYDGDGNRVKMTVDVAHGPNGRGNGKGKGQGNGNGNGNGPDNGNGQFKCGHVVPPGFVPPGLAKKCGPGEEPYPDEQPGGPRDGWESQHKKKHWEFHYTNDISLALPEVLQVTEDDATKWKESFVYGAGMERISMTYLPAYDHDNGWEPTPGAGGADPDVTPKTLYYMTDIMGSTIGLLTQDGRLSARYHYDEFGMVLDSKKFDVNWPGPDNLYGYTGLEYDYYTDLNYARARYYKPEIGRFISEDTYKGTLWNTQSQNLYAYVYNNPLIYTDPSGHIPTPMEAAQMAEHIYSQSGKLSGGWLFVRPIEGGDNMVMGVYSRIKDDGTTEYALVNKGTTINSGDDWKNNSQQLLGLSADMKASIEESGYFVSKHSNNEITMVGHSKGGAEAAANAVATNKNSIIFNPATVNLGVYDLSSSNYSASMTAFIVKGDALNGVVGWFSKPIDKVNYLPQQYGGGWRNLWKTSAYDKIRNHSMGAVINALKEAGYK